MARKLKTKKTFFAVFIAVFCYSQVAKSDDVVEFNTDVLDASDRQNVDLKRFASGNYIAPGTYLLEVHINGQQIPEQQIRYVADPETPEKSRVCLTPDQLVLLALKEEAQSRVAMLSPECADISTLPGVAVNNSAGVLSIMVPQAWMKYSDPDWVPPERWDNGVAGLLFDYNLTGQLSHYQDSGSDYRSLSGYGQAGMNLGGWRLRAQYQAELTSSNGGNSVNWDQIYAYRPLPMMAAKLTAGEIYLDSQLFDSVRFTGINLASDERMLPPNLQGYAPEIHGIAKSNARVTVSQNAHVVYQTTVPAGPFNIQDLRSAVRGTLDVKVEEQDGSVQTFQVNTANIPYLTRPGYVRYNTALGKPSRYNHKLQGPAFYTGDFSWGISNAWSLYGGTILTGERYNAWSLGIGRDLDVLGAMSLDVTQSSSRVRDTQRGSSVKFSYAKTFDEYHSSITFAGYRFSQKSYRTLSQFLDEMYQHYDSIGHEREMYTITGNKTFWAEDPARATTLFLTYTHQNYWDRASQDRYGLSVAHSFNIAGLSGITANLSAWRSDYQGQRDDSLSLSLSVPWGDGNWAGYDLQSAGGDVSQMISWNDNRRVNDSWRVRAGHGSDGRVAVDGYYQHRATMAEMESSVSYQQGRYVSVGGTLRGGVTATRYGAALHNSEASLNSARVMVDTDGVANVPLNGQRVHSNRFGIAVVPDVVSYHSFDTRIDVDTMDQDIEANKAIATSTLTEGAIGYQHFAVAQGERMMAHIRRPDGSAPPFGADVFSHDGVSVGMVMEGGEVWLAGVQANETLSVVWDGQVRCQLRVPQTIRHDSAVLLPCR
jgi:outer membrane usher protein PapC